MKHQFQFEPYACPTSSPIFFRTQGLVLIRKNIALACLPTTKYFCFNKLRTGHQLIVAEVQVTRREVATQGTCTSHPFLPPSPNYFQVDVSSESRLEGLFQIYEFYIPGRAIQT